MIFTFRAFAILAVSLIIGVGRFFVPGHDLSLAGTYEALAHIWVGVLLVLCCQWRGPEAMTAARERIWLYPSVAIGSLTVLTAIEVVMFMAR